MHPAIPPPAPSSPHPRIGPIPVAPTPRMGFLEVVRILKGLGHQARRREWGPDVYIRAWDGEMDTPLVTYLEGRPYDGGRLSLAVEDCLADDWIIESIPPVVP